MAFPWIQTLSRLNLQHSEEPGRIKATFWFCLVLLWKRHLLGLALEMGTNTSLYASAFLEDTLSTGSHRSSASAAQCEHVQCTYDTVWTPKWKQVMNLLSTDHTQGTKVLLWSQVRPSLGLTFSSFSLFGLNKLSWSSSVITLFLLSHHPFHRAQSLQPWSCLCCFSCPDHTSVSKPETVPWAQPRLRPSSWSSCKNHPKMPPNLYKASKWRCRALLCVGLLRPK